LTAIAAVLISGCKGMLNPVRRQPLQFNAMQTSLRPMPQKILVQLEGPLLGQPLAETVWDNAYGPFHNFKESNQIGYTLDYIVIPFGRIFETVFDSGLGAAFPNSRICSNVPNESDQLWAASAQIVKLKVVDFETWEDPMNHLNLEATVRCQVYPDLNSDKPESEFETHHKMLNQSLGSVMSTSTGFIREMNKISHRFAGVLSENILEQLQKTFAEQEAQPTSDH
jgi:hypothetical protein